MRRAYPAEAYQVASSQSQSTNPFSPQPPQTATPVNSNAPVFQTYTPQPQTIPQPIQTTPSVSPLVPSTPFGVPSPSNPNNVVSSAPVVSSLHYQAPVFTPQPVINNIPSNNSTVSRPPPFETLKTATVTSTMAPKLEFFDEESFVPVNKVQYNVPKAPTTPVAYPGPPIAPTHGNLAYAPPLNPNEVSAPPLQPPVNPTPLTVGKRPIGPELAPAPAPSPYTANAQSQSPSRGLEVAGATPVPRPEWKAPPEFCQMSIEAIPRTDALLDKVGIPLGITFTPLAEAKTVCYFFIDFFYSFRSLF